MTFRLVDPEKPSDDRARRARRQALRQRQVLPSLGDHRAAAPRFVPSDALCTAVNVALAVGAPLLLTGEPGTGKTQVAHYLAWHLGLEDRLYQLDVRSSTTAADLIYRFDSVAYFHAAQDQAHRSAPLDRRAFIHRGPLWQALDSDEPAIVMLDEIDKAPRDFPNDILGVIDQHRFFVPEANDWVTRRPGVAPPLLVVTSNSERRLPEPFLRRCVFHHIELTEETLRRAVAARRADFAGLDDGVISAALERLWELRGRSLRKRPATGELLVWLAALAAQGGVDAARLRALPLRELPALTTLVKDSDDLKAL